jgi:hypothetical protein
MAASLLAMLALAYFSWLMLRITLQYVPVNDDVAFLRIKQDIIGITHWRIAFFTHVFSSMFVLLAGFTQFWRGILRKAPSVHRWMGRLYVVDVLFITGPAGFIMALYANGGVPSRIAFTILASLWIFTTAIAFRQVLRRKFASHREWMIRSYALTLSAISLRAWKLSLALLFHPHPMDLYRMAAWLGWVPNLLLAELLIRRTRVAQKPRVAIISPDESPDIPRPAARDGFIAAPR